MRARAAIWRGCRSLRSLFGAQRRRVLVQALQQLGYWTIGFPALFNAGDGRLIEAQQLTKLGLRNIAEAETEIANVNLHNPMLCTTHSARQCPSHSIGMHNAFMASEEKERKARAGRLVSARMSCANVHIRANATEAAKLMGIKPPTYLAHENGSRGFNAQKAEKYAKFYQVEVLWLLFGTGQARTRAA